MNFTFEVVEDDRALDDLLVIASVVSLVEVAVHFDPQRHPRWPKGTPHGGEFIRVGQFFKHDGQDYQVSQIVAGDKASDPGRVVADLADGKHAKTIVLDAVAMSSGGVSMNVPKKTVIWKNLKAGDVFTLPKSANPTSKVQVVTPAKTANATIMAFPVVDGPSNTSEYHKPSNGLVEMDGDVPATMDSIAVVPNISAATPRQVKGGKLHSNVTVVDPYVDASTHDPSIPIPETSTITPEEWEAFGKLDQEQYVEVQERFGKWKVGAGQNLYDKTYEDYTKELKAALGDYAGGQLGQDLAYKVKSGYDSQYGSSDGGSISLTEAFQSVAEKTVSEKDFAMREQAMVLQGEHKAVVQWDLYNRTHSPDVASFHKSKNSDSQDHAYWKPFFEGKKNIFSGLSQSWQYRWSFFSGHNNIGVAIPLAIRHVLMSTESYKPSGSAQSFTDEREIAVPEQMKLDGRSYSFMFNPSSPDPGYTLSNSAKNWLEKITAEKPVGGGLIQRLHDYLDGKGDLPLPPEPPMVHMQGGAQQAWKAPDAEAYKGIEQRAYKNIFKAKVMSVGEWFLKDGKSYEVTSVNDDGSVDGKPMEGKGDAVHIGADEEYPIARPANQGVKAGDYIQGLQGARYIVVSDPSDDSGFGLRRVEGTNAGPSSNAYTFSGGGAKPFYKLEGSYTPPQVEKGTWNPSEWGVGQNTAKLMDFPNGAKFKIDGNAYEVTGQSGGSTLINDLSTDQAGTASSLYVASPLVKKDGSGPSFIVGATPDPNAPWGGWKPEVGDRVSYAPPMAVPDEGGSGAQGYTVSKVSANGSVTIKKSGFPTATISPSSGGAKGVTNWFRPTDWEIGAKTKLKNVPVGGYVHQGAGTKQKPYKVIAQGAKTTTLLDMQTGEEHQLSRNISYAQLVSLKQVEAGQVTPGETNMTPPPGPGQAYKPSGFDPSEYTLGPETQAGQLPVGSFFQTHGGGNWQVSGLGQSDTVNIINPADGSPEWISSWEYVNLWTPKTTGRVGAIPSIITGDDGYSHFDVSGFTLGSAKQPISYVPVGSLVHTYPDSNSDVGTDALVTGPPNADGKIPVTTAYNVQYPDAAPTLYNPSVSVSVYSPISATTGPAPDAGGFDPSTWTLGDTPHPISSMDPGTYFNFVAPGVGSTFKITGGAGPEIAGVPSIQVEYASGPQKGTPANLVGTVVGNVWSPPDTSAPASPVKIDSLPIGTVVHGDGVHGKIIAQSGTLGNPMVDVEEKNGSGTQTYTHTVQASTLVTPEPALAPAAPSLFPADKGWYPMAAGTVANGVMFRTSDGIAGVMQSSNGETVGTSKAQTIASDGGLATTFSVGNAETVYVQPASGQWSGTDSGKAFAGIDYGLHGSTPEAPLPPTTDAEAWQEVPLAQVPVGSKFMSHLENGLPFQVVAAGLGSGGVGGGTKSSVSKIMTDGTLAGKLTLSGDVKVWVPKASKHEGLVGQTIVSDGGPGGSFKVTGVSGGLIQGHWVKNQNIGTISFGAYEEFHWHPVDQPAAPEPLKPHDPAKWSPDELTTLGELKPGDKFTAKDGEDYEKVSVWLSTEIVKNLATGKLQSMHPEDPVTKLAPKSQAGAGARPVPGDVVTPEQLRVGDEFKLGMGPLKGGDFFYKLISTDGPDGPVAQTWIKNYSGNGTKQYGASQGNAQAFQYPVKTLVANNAGQSDSLPGVLLLKSAKQSTQEEMNKGKEPSLDGDYDPGDLPTAPLQGYDTAYAKGAKASGGFAGKKDKIKDMAPGTIFKDKTGLLWKLKQTGSTAVVTDGISNFKVDGELRGRASLTLHELPAGDKSPPVAGTPEFDAMAGMTYNGSDSDLLLKDLSPGDQVVLPEWPGTVMTLTGFKGNTAQLVDGNGKVYQSGFGMAPKFMKLGKGIEQEPSAKVEPNTEIPEAFASADSSDYKAKLLSKLPHGAHVLDGNDDEWTITAQGLSSKWTELTDAHDHAVIAEDPSYGIPTGNVVGAQIVDVNLLKKGDVIGTTPEQPTFTLAQDADPILNFDVVLKDGNKVTTIPTNGGQHLLDNFNLLATGQPVPQSSFTPLNVAGASFVPLDPNDYEPVGKKLGTYDMTRGQVFIGPLGGLFRVKVAATGPINHQTPPVIVDAQGEIAHVAGNFEWKLAKKLKSEPASVPHVPDVPSEPGQSNVVGFPVTDPAALKRGDVIASGNGTNWTVLKQIKDPNGDMVRIAKADGSKTSNGNAYTSVPHYLIMDANAPWLVTSLAGTPTQPKDELPKALDVGDPVQGHDQLKVGDVLGFAGDAVANVTVSGKDADGKALVQFDNVDAEPWPLADSVFDKEHPEGPLVLKAHGAAPEKEGMPPFTPATYTGGPWMTIGEFDVGQMFKGKYGGYHQVLGHDGSGNVQILSVTTGKLYDLPSSAKRQLQVPKDGVSATTEVPLSPPIEKSPQPAKPSPEQAEVAHEDALKGGISSPTGIPNYDGQHLDLTGGESAGGTTGARIVKAGDGTEFLLKTYDGNENRVATELLANSIYREMGAKVANAGTVTMPDKSVALAYPLLPGKPKQITEPSAELGKHFMTDALVANWDFIGAVDDNVLWDKGVPFRVDQGGTFQYRAQGAKKDYGAVPGEVWSLLEGAGQGNGKVEVSLAQKRAQAAEIGKKLTPSRIDDLTDAVPFTDSKMADEVNEALKARVQWMRLYAKGKVLEPGQEVVPTEDLPSNLPEPKEPKPNVYSLKHAPPVATPGKLKASDVVADYGSLMEVPEQSSFQPYKSQWGQGAKFKNHKLSQLKPGNRFVDKTGTDYTLVGIVDDQALIVPTAAYDVSHGAEMTARVSADFLVKVIGKA